MLQQAVRLDAIKRFSIHNLKIDKSYTANQALTPYFELNIGEKNSNESLETVINVTTCDMLLSTIVQSVKKCEYECGWGWGHQLSVFLKRNYL